ncbi:MAG TPA: tetratricopeptide repeat protein [Acidocella sp.]|jgi:tetratricopeptide (TPR) repeat protein|nr:tetratricopeptide repeat protein [Acidocella sp.]
MTGGGDHPPPPGSDQRQADTSANGAQMKLPTAPIHFPFNKRLGLRGFLIYRISNKLEGSSVNRQQRRAKMKQEGLGKTATSPALEAAFASALRHHQAGRFNEARALYREVAQKNPLHADSLHMLGMIEHHMGHFDTAIGLIKRAIDLNDRVAPYHFNLGRAFEEVRQLDEAAASYRQAVQLWPDNADIYANLGNVLGDLWRLEEAAICFRKALEIEPGFP